MNPYNNFYNPYSQPFQAAQAQFNQFPMSQPTQQFQAQQSGPAVLSVATIKQVEQVPVQPGRQVLVMVQNDPVIAMRTADQMGLVQTDYYHIQRFDPEQAAPSHEYATKTELAQLQGVVQQILDGMNSKPAARTNKKEAQSE